MESIIIARLLGPLMLVSAAAILLNRRGIQETMSAAAKNPSFIYLAGIMTFLSGLAIVETHNVWTADWRVTITILGWLMVVGGAARMMIPDQLAKMGSRLVKQTGLLEIGATISALIGVFLTIKAF